MGAGIWAYRPRAVVCCQVASCLAGRSLLRGRLSRPATLSPVPRFTSSIHYSRCRFLLLFFRSASTLKAHLVGHRRFLLRRHVVHFARSVAKTCQQSFFVNLASCENSISVPSIERYLFATPVPIFLTVGGESHRPRCGGQPPFRYSSSRSSSSPSRPMA